MINLYIFVSVLIGFLILLSIQFKIYNPSNPHNQRVSNPPNHQLNNNNSHILDYYGKYGSVGNYSNSNDFKSKCQK